MKLRTSCTLPRNKGDYWQIVLLPTISILGSDGKYSSYICVTFEWLFWSFTISTESK